MKKLLFLLVFLPLLCHAKVDSVIRDSFSKYEKSSYTGRSNVNFLKTFIGDTITFNFTSQYLDGFSVESPDTIWVKKRPKKNPELGKHYILNHAYKGRHVGENFLTPVSAINDIPFVIYSVTPDNSGDGCFITLLDLKNLDLIKANFPHTFSYDGSFTTAKTQRIIDSLKGMDVYYSPEVSSYNKPSFSKCKVIGGDFTVNISKSTGVFQDYRLHTDCEIRLQDENGKNFSMSPLKSDGYSGKTPVLLTQEEYDNQYRVYTIDSDVDIAILDEESNFPFSFLLIPGLTTGSYTSVYQSLDPNSPYRSADAHLANREIVTIADKINVGEKSYYKACYNGKAFFINSKDVILEDESEAKLDTLLRQPLEIKDKFFKNQVALSKAFYLNYLNEGVKKVESFAKYGLAIPKWSVYDMSDYTEGTGIEIFFYNPTKQDIKYITITFQGYNAVDDPVGRPVTRKCIGPIAPDASVSYDFDYVWLTDIIDYAKIKSIVVQYRNGSTKTISNPQSVMFSPELRDFFFMSNPVTDLK